MDLRIHNYQAMVERLLAGDFTGQLEVDQLDEQSYLGEALNALASQLLSEQRLSESLSRIFQGYFAELPFEAVLEQVYQDFRTIIPYDRISVSLIEDDGAAVRAYWARSELPSMQISPGFSTPLDGTSLKKLIDSGKPRIINDLREYLLQHPNSFTTQLILSEGLHASLTCPLVVRGQPVGFLYFSSRHPCVYERKHIDISLRLAQQLALIVDRERMLGCMAAKQVAMDGQNEELRRLNDLKYTFLGVVGHDLRSPLSYILTTADLLNSAYPTLDREAIMMIFEGIGKQASYMLSLLNDLLDFSQIEAGNLILRQEIISLTPLIKSVVRDHEKQAAQKKIRIEVESLARGSLFADGARLRQVIENLLSNAIKYSPEGSVVRLRTFQKEDQWRLEVQDQGPGIKPEELNRVFKPFTRLSSRPTAGEKSTGLGLAIARMLIEAHGGQIGVEPAPQTGSIFWFTLQKRME